MVRGDFFFLTLTGAGPGIGGGMLAPRRTLEAGEASIPQALGAFSQTTSGTRPRGAFMSW